MWSVRIENWHPTPLNKLMNCHWAKRNRLKKSDYVVVAAAMYSADIPKASCKRKVWIEIVLGPRQRGCDGDAYLKVALDALVACGALKNDNKEWMELGGISFGRGPRKATIITLEDVDPCADLPQVAHD